jgi:hypothetical protein
MSKFRDHLTSYLVHPEHEYTSEDPTYELKNGFEYLHKGYCNMTDAQRVLFDVEFGHGVREALIKFANIEPAANADIANHVKGEFLEYIQEA